MPTLGRPCKSAAPVTAPTEDRPDGDGRLLVPAHRALPERRGRVTVRNAIIIIIATPIPPAALHGGHSAEHAVITVNAPTDLWRNTNKAHGSVKLLVVRDKLNREYVAPHT